MDLSYFQKINNTYGCHDKQETDLFLLNRHVEECFSDSIDYQRVHRNGKKYELIIIRDTDGNAFKKKVKSRPSQPFNLGDYIEWNGQIWLIMRLDPDDKTYHSGYMYLCNVLLYFQDANGSIQKRWSYAEDYTKYSSGEKGNSVVTLGDYQYGITLSADPETQKWTRGKRFAIDYEGNNPPDIYELTNKKPFLNDYSYFGRGGLITFTFSYNLFNPITDKLITLPEGEKVWICDYKETNSTTPLSPSPPPIMSAIISGDTSLKLDFPRTYTVDFSDNDGNKIVDVPYEWKIESDIKNLINITQDQNKITLFVNDRSLIKQRFHLQVIVENKVLGDKEITISDIY